MAAVLYQLNDHRMDAVWDLVKKLIAKAVFTYTFFKKHPGSCRAAAWAAAWQPAGGAIDERYILAAQSDGTNHAEEIILQQMMTTYGSTNFDHMYVDISPCTGTWRKHHCMSLLTAGNGTTIPEPSGTVWYALSEDQYERGYLQKFRDQGTAGDQFLYIASNYAGKKY